MNQGVDTIQEQADSDTSRHFFRGRTKLIFSAIRRVILVLNSRLLSSAKVVSKERIWYTGSLLTAYAALKAEFCPE